VSPIARGPAELSHSVLRVLEDDEYREALTTGGATALHGSRSALKAFLVDALTQHASDRGLRYESCDRDLGLLLGQFELWSQALASGAIERKRLRVSLQLALAEEFNSHLFRS